MPHNSSAETPKALPQTLLYGADYNPEQWPDEVITQDLELMRTAGVNMVNLGIFGWANLEPREGEYNFAWLEKLMDRLHEAGIMVDLGTGTASPPAWMAQNYPETLPMDASGRVLGFGSRQQFAPASPVFREKTAALVRALATALGKHPALRMWHINNEYGCHVKESFDPHTVAAFRRWLENKYGTIEKLNDHWATNFWSQRYLDFSQIGAPGPMPAFPNPAQVLDWKRFSSDMQIEALEVEAAILRELTPQIPIMTNLMELLPEIDYWKLASHIDVVADDCYPDPADPASAAREAFGGDLMRSLAGNKPYLLLEQTTAGVQWRPGANPVKRPGQFRNWSLSRVARGANGIMQFQWRQSRGGAEAMHSAMVPHAGTASPTWQRVVDLGQTLKKLADAADLQALPQAQIAMVLDWDNIWAQTSACGPVDYEPIAQIRHWHQLCFEAGFVVDFVRPEADLSSYPVILVVGQIAPQTELLTSLELAAKAGAKVLITAPFAIFDSSLRAHLGGYQADFSRLTGVKTIDLYPLSTPADVDAWTTVHPSDRISGQVKAAPTTDHHLEWDHAALAAVAQRFSGVGDSSKAVASFNTKTAPITRWAELLDPQHPQVSILATYSDQADDLAKLPALTANQVGEGTVFYLSTLLHAEGEQNAGAQLLAYLTADLDNEVAPYLLPGVEAVKRGNLTFVLNHSESAVTLPAPRLCLLQGREIDTLAERSAAVFSD